MSLAPIIICNNFSNGFPRNVLPPLCGNLWCGKNMKSSKWSKLKTYFVWPHNFDGAKKLQKGEPNALVTWNQKVPMLYKFQDNGKTWLSIIKCFVVEVFDLCHWGFHKIVLILNYVYNYTIQKKASYLIFEAMEVNLWFLESTTMMAQVRSCEWIRAFVVFLYVTR